MTRKTFAQLMDEVFITGDPNATTTATTTEAPPLTAAIMLEAIEQLRATIVYYITSEHVEDVGAVYKLPNDQARAGYDLVCHPDMLPALRLDFAGKCVLLPMNDAERQRRDRLVGEKLRDAWLSYMMT